MLIVKAEPDNKLGAACLHVVKEVMNELSLQVLAGIKEGRRTPAGLDDAVRFVRYDILDFFQVLKATG